MKGKTRTKYLKRLQKFYKYKQRRTKKQQHDRFLKRFDFAYAGRDTVNQIMEGLDSLAPKLNNQTSEEIDKIEEARIRQAINDGGQQYQNIAPQIIRGAIEDIYKTLFKLLGNFGKIFFSQIKRKISTLVKK